MPGSNNDIIVVERSPIVNKFLANQLDDLNFDENGKPYTRGGCCAVRNCAIPVLITPTGYYLADGIYPEWSIFVKTYRNPDTPHKKLFAKMQEGARKDVERAFGALQAKWHVLVRPSRVWRVEVMHNIIMTCIILHNMMVEANILRMEQGENWTPRNIGNPRWVARVEQTVEIMGMKRRQTRDGQIHANLKMDLMGHIWDKFGGLE